MNQPWLQILIPVLGLVLASQGFWAWLMKRGSGKDSTTRIVMGLAYTEIIRLGMTYIDRGWVSNDEYEDYCKYFYEPYKALGGNGVAERMKNDVEKLPIRDPRTYYRIGQHRQREDHYNDRQSQAFSRTTNEQPRL